MRSRGELAILLIFVFFAFFAGCSWFKLNEAEYSKKADEAYSKGLYKVARLYYKTLVVKFPESEKADFYKERLADVLVQLALTAPKDKLVDTYLHEIEALNLPANDTVLSWLKYRRAKKVEDEAKRDKLLSEITYDQYLLAAQYELNRSKFPEALTIYEDAIKYHKGEKELYKALFLAGFISSEYVKDTAAARKYFEEVVKNYPDCDLADDAQWMLNNMGKPPEEVMFLPDTATKK